jgi:SAM-dependent methyltransferase
MRVSHLSPEEVLEGYDKVSGLYPFVPPLSAWRAWEYAAYRRYLLPEPVLDVGCGDGQFLRLVWPGLQSVEGVDISPAAVEAAKSSGVYRAAYLAAAHELAVPPESYAAAFANCSLEHMDHLPLVLRRIARSLRPGGPFLLSVVTDRFLEWAVVPQLARCLGEPARAERLQSSYEEYQHVVNPLPPPVWAAHLEAAGFEIVEHVPIVPELSTRLFLFLDGLWHAPRLGGELGDLIGPYLGTVPRFPHAFRQVLAAVMEMETDWGTGSGAVFWARRGR